MMMGLRRDIDVAARYGGEEFAIILPNTPILAAHAVGERMRATLATSEAVLPVGARSSAEARSQACLDEASGAPAHAGGAAKVGERLRRDIERATVLNDDGETLDRVTVSVGVAAFPDHAGDAGGLVKAADDALYTAKRAGKNRVCLADLSDCE
jgi:PleD family two-component response regulator